MNKERNDESSYIYKIKTYDRKQSTYETFTEDKHQTEKRKKRVS